jgi:AcrR family transcriptional regulator
MHNLDTERKERRPYQLKSRALSQAQTRAKIVEATAELHATVGPARTQVSEIARRAGVQRRTVYDHFPDDAALIQACSHLWLSRNPLPDPAHWQGIKTPVDRVSAALRAVYDFYSQDEKTLALVLRDSSGIAALSAVLDDGLLRFLAGVRDDLVAALLGPKQARVRTAALVGIALDFWTWRRLTSVDGFSNSEAARLMACVTKDGGCR